MNPSQFYVVNFTLLGMYPIKMLVSGSVVQTQKSKVPFTVHDVFTCL